MAKTLRRATLGELEAEIRRRQTNLDKLSKQRADLAAKLAEIDRQIQQAGGAAEGAAAPVRGKPGPKPGRKRKTKKTKRQPGRRARGGVALTDVLAEVMSSGEPMSTAEAADRVLKTGYKTRAKNFNNVIYQALHSDPRFQRVGRGQYALVQ
ncbi:MAG: hypothetical protein WD294_04100 [Phycisphaeraceae bacterium]